MKINGLPVLDANSQLFLQISKNDIKKSKKKDERKCAAATAICRADSNVEEAIVHLTRAYIKLRENDFYIRYNVPTNLRTEIVSFDRGGDMDAGSYVLRPLQPSKKLGNDKRKRTKTKKSSKNVKISSRHITGNVRKHMPVFG